MGLYDTIIHKIKCPKCGNEFEFSEQIKWTNNCLLYNYKVGDKIDAADGEYTYATWIRKELVTKCNHCDEKIYYKIIVKDGILTEIKLI